MKVLSESVTKSRESLCTEFRLNVKSAKYEQLHHLQEKSDRLYVILGAMWEPVLKD